MTEKTLQTILMPASKNMSNAARRARKKRGIGEFSCPSFENSKTMLLCAKRAREKRGESVNPIVVNMPDNMRLLTKRAREKRIYEENRSWYQKAYDYVKNFYK